ncbi:MAG: F0F1 ATP synthase subunit B [Bacteroidia bacterium]|nr:F0F1 ATP synthase subunit B [Bacteroidia bacterium]
MKINWFTVIAQVINFLILVWLLKKFLYKPVLAAIDAREKKIESRLEDAKNKKEEAKKEQDEFSEKNKQFDQQKKELMDKAIADTKVQKDKLMVDAKKDVDDIHDKQQKALKDMEEDLKKDLAQKTQKEVFNISRKALTDLASVSLEEQSVKVFISRIEDLKDKEKQQFIDAFESESSPVLIQSAFELHKKQQTEIRKAVDEILGKETEFEFKTSPGIISGIELKANGYKLSWNIAAYLDSLQNSISETIKEKAELTIAAKHVKHKKPEGEKKQALEKEAEKEKK